MADVLLLGMTHFPRLRLPDDQWNLLILKMLNDPGVPEHMKDPSSWPKRMREQWSTDRGLAAAQAERRELIDDFSRMRAELERFQPDVVIMWGDDQYENFREDGIPPFAVLGYESMSVAQKSMQLEPGTTVQAVKSAEEMHIQGDRQRAKYLATGLIERGFDITYAYQPRHVGLGHAFLNTILFLTSEKRAFPWPVIPFAVNCYGRFVISHHGMPRGLSEVAKPEDMDPPSPLPWRCFDLGGACATIAKESPWRVALLASASWSHAFFTRKNYFLYPDMEADLNLFEDFKAGRFEAWRARTQSQIEDSGQQETLNWMCLAGAFAELGIRPRYSRFHESYIFNSPKVFVAGGG